MPVNHAFCEWRKIKYTWSVQIKVSLEGTWGASTHTILLIAPIFTDVTYGKLLGTLNLKCVSG